MADEMKSNDVQQLWQSQTTEEFRMSPEEIRRRIQALKKSIRRTNIVGYVSSIAVGIGSIWWLTQVQNAIERTGAIMTIVGVAYLLYQLSRNQSGIRARRAAAGGDVTSIEFHRNELAQQRDFFRGIPLWSRSLIFAPGPLVFMAGIAIASPERRTAVYAEMIIFLVLAAMAIPRGRKAAARYQTQIDELDRLGSH